MEVVSLRERLLDKVIKLERMVFTFIPIKIASHKDEYAAQELPQQFLISTKDILHKVTSYKTPSLPLPLSPALPPLDPEKEADLDWCLPTPPPPGNRLLYGQGMYKPAAGAPAMGNVWLYLFLVHANRLARHLCTLSGC